MRMRLHVDSTIGDEYIYPIYNINYDTLAALPNFITTIGPTTAEGYTIHKFYVQNDAGLITTGIPATVPRFPEQTGNILPQRFAYTEELGGIKYLATRIGKDLEPTKDRNTSICNVDEMGTYSRV